MTREEAIRKTLDTVLWTRNASDDNKNILTDALIEALEHEPSDKQRYVVRGINNDKIEFIDKYSVRAFNRYIKVIKDFCKYEVLDKIRAEIESITPKAHIRKGKLSIDTELMIPLDRVLKILDKYKAESEDK